MGIGMLIIFISTILVAAVAAGVLIRTTGLLQQRALLVEEATRQRLVNGLQIISVIGYANLSSETLSKIELLTRLRAGSTPVRMADVGLTFVSGDFAIGANLNTSISGNSSCTFDALTSENEFCFEPRLGDSDLILEADELIIIRFKLNESHALDPKDEFEMSLMAGSGAIEVLELKTPDVILRNLVRIR